MAGKYYDAELSGLISRMRKAVTMLDLLSNQKLKTVSQPYFHVSLSVEICVCHRHSD